MATIDEELLGKLSGSLGNIVIKNNKGRRYVATKPGSFIPGSDPGSVARRDKFALTGKLSKRIYNINCLKTIWKKYAPGTTIPFNLITKTNYPNVSSSILTDDITLTPTGGFEVNVNSVQMNATEVQAVINHISASSGINPVSEPGIVLVSILYLSNSNDESGSPYAFISLLSAPQVTQLSAQLTFSIPYSNQDRQVFNNYRDKKGFFCLITLDPDDNPVHYSSTFVSS